MQLSQCQTVPTVYVGAWSRLTSIVWFTCKPLAKDKGLISTSLGPNWWQENKHFSPEMEPVIMDNLPWPSWECGRCDPAGDWWLQCHLCELRGTGGFSWQHMELWERWILCVHSTALTFFLHSGVNLCQIPFSWSDLQCLWPLIKSTHSFFGAACAGETKVVYKPLTLGLD